MDERFRTAIVELGRLGVIWSYAVFLDLNCGTARILRLLPPLRQYVGNDVLPRPAVFDARLDASFWRMTDAAALSDIQRSPAAQDDFRGVDGPLVLSCFGFSNSPKPEDQCSPTLEQTYRKLLHQRPGFTVLEKAVRWLQPAWEELASWPEWAGYEVIDIDVYPKAPQHLEWRRVRVARRKG